MNFPDKYNIQIIKEFQNPIITQNMYLKVKNSVYSLPIL